MQILGQIVRYSEGSHQHIAIITHVVDDDRGIVNLAVFPADGGCVGRTSIPSGTGSGRWSPLHPEAATATLVEGTPLLAGVERELVSLRSRCERLETTIDALTSKVLQCLDMLQDPPRPNEPEEPAPSTPSAAPAPTE